MDRHVERTSHRSRLGEPRQPDADHAPRPLREAVEEVIAGLDAGRLRVAEKAGGQWVTHQWIKKAVLLSFRLQDNRVMQGGATRYYDKVPVEVRRTSISREARAGFRVVPPAVARRGASSGEERRAHALAT